MNFPVFDLHCDTSLELLGKRFDSCCSLRNNDGHIDLLRASNLPGYAQCFACFTTDGMSRYTNVSPETIFSREKAAITQQVQQNQDMILQAYSADDIETNRKNGLMSAILTIEGTAGISFDAAALEDLYKEGFRITSLGWNESNPLTGSHITKEGLSELGVSYVKEAQRVGMIIDVSHISDAAFWDIMEITTGPVIATHSNSRTVWNVSRNLTDEMFLAICRTGGVAGINLYANFLGEDPDLDTVCDHILHFLTLDPSGKHISLGGDLDGCEKLPNGFEGVQDYPKLAQRLLERGVSEETVMDIFWNNALGVIRRAVCKHP